MAAFNQTINGTVTILGNLSVSGSVAQTGTVTASGTANLTGTVSFGSASSGAVYSNSVSVGSLTLSTATSGAVTLSAKFGRITTGALSTLANTTYALTITNTMVSTGDLIFVNLQNGSNSSAFQPYVTTVTSGNGVFTVNLTTSTALNGSLIFSYMLIK